MEFVWKHRIRRATLLIYMSQIRLTESDFDFENNELKLSDQDLNVYAKELNSINERERIHFNISQRTNSTFSL